MPKTISVAVPEACTLCPRQCKADRAAGQTGFCGAGRTLKAARAALHFWEEPCISGTRGSGTVFFSGCSLGCVFCQNDAISHQDFGRPISLERLRAICFELIDQGAHNINFVNPTHYAHVVRALLEEHPMPVPVVWNSGGYDRVETLRGLGYDPYVMIYEKPTAPPITRCLQQWVNNKRVFHVVENFYDFEPVKKLRNSSMETR